MSGSQAQHHYAHAAVRHYNDAVYLQDGDRVPNADHLFGFAVECALKSMLLRFTPATMNPKRPGKPPATRPWVADPATGKVDREFGHLPGIATDVALLTHGRSAARLSAAIRNLDAFDTWSVDDRYLDGTAIVEEHVMRRRTVAEEILALHQQAVITGRLL
ncbi:hypothetical protein HH310_17710 [Actinoplanes sp. TBRC 11911]|uniref:hypothetical protein n=1 Tax=Actinoplanes sp. TBRC 11911 TaxID=2729386 RepID=UPI00145F1236|nr:hypothetical protein [Actinoplanes sp. TBRC 11911]NMO53020.1 hypothetical protein [Actinoplanes sp. TBRC 11911]